MMDLFTEFRHAVVQMQIQSRIYFTRDICEIGQTSQYDGYNCNILIIYSDIGLNIA